MKRHTHLFHQITSFENLYLAAKKVMKGKKSKDSVAFFYFYLENEIFHLQRELVLEVFRPSPYTQFTIREPKERVICSSSLRDRVVHHALSNLVEPLFERRAIFDSYACRTGKGLHSALRRCQVFARQFKYFLKCDIKGFFSNIDHAVLKTLLKKVFKERKLIELFKVIIDHKIPDQKKGKALPIGNLTSQHFANFYLGELDHFVKDQMGVKAYLRYMDDFILFSNDKRSLICFLERIN